MKPQVQVRIPGYRQPFLLRRGSSDLSVFETVFLDREFDVYVPDDPRLIIDGGANVGYSTAFFARRFGDATVLAIEPSSENLAMLKTNCKGLKNVTAVEGGLWPTSCRLRIANPQDPAWSFRCEQAPAGATGTFPAYSIEDLIDRSGHERCDLLKLDVEGAEEQLFSQPGNWLSRVDAILVEIHGPMALAAVQRACPDSDWVKTNCGEKLMLVSREMAALRSRPHTEFSSEPARRA
jgi:FkbM family methyltransferase